MAGIGFSLRKILDRDTLSRVFAAYTVAGIISGGPWLISIMGIIVLGIIIALTPGFHIAIAQFQVSVTYLVAFSLILSGLAGYSFSRYVADELYLNRSNGVIPNLNGLLSVITTVSGMMALLFSLFFFTEQSISYHLFMLGSFVLLCNIWVLISLLTGLKDYKIILYAFFASYSLIVVLGFLLRRNALDGFIFAFFVGHALLFFLLYIVIYNEYPTEMKVDFHFFKKNKHKILVLNGLLFNLAVWVDKFIFWFHPATSYPVIGPLRASVLYDPPIFLAYLFSLPGMAVFLLLIETNFADYYERFNEAIRRGKPLSYIKMTGEQMIGYAMDMLFVICKVQAIVVIIVFQFGVDILRFLHISTLSSNLLYIAVIGTSLQVIFLAIINILYYMDKLMNVFWLSLLFLILNLLLTSSSIYLGAFYYGFGFTCSLIITCTVGLYFVNEEFTDLEYKVIMLQ